MMSGYVGYRGSGDFVKRQPQVVIETCGITNVVCLLPQQYDGILLEIDFDRLAAIFKQSAGTKLRQFGSITVS